MEALRQHFLVLEPPVFLEKMKTDSWRRTQDPVDYLKSKVWKSSDLTIHRTIQILSPLFDFCTISQWYYAQGENLFFKDLEELNLFYSQCHHALRENLYFQRPQRMKYISQSMASCTERKSLFSKTSWNEIYSTIIIILPVNFYRLLTG